MKAVIIYPWEYPENRGIAQLTSLLKRLGFEVDIVSLFVRYDRIKHFEIGIKNLCISNNINKISKYIFKGYPFFNVWKRKLSRLCVARKWDFIFVRESLLANACLAVGKKYSIPIFLDMRENRPEMIKSNVSYGFKKIFLKSYYILI